MQLDQPLDERQAEAEPAAVPIERVVALHERLEQALDQSGVDSRPGVRHLQDGLARSVGSAETETVTAPPGGLNLIAFESRLVITWEIRAPSALTMTGASGTLTSSRTPPSSRWERLSWIVSRTT